MKYEQYKVNERYRKLQNKEKTVEVEEAGQCSSNASPDSSFTNKQTLHHSLSRTDNHLPKSPLKKAEVIEKLVEKYQVKIPFKNTKRGRPRKDLNEEEKDWLENFLSRIDVSYTNPGRKDHVYVGKIDGERRYKQRLYLLWTLRDLLDIANGSGKVDVTDSFYQNFEKLLTFSQLYDFLKYHKEYCYNQNIPHGSCLCEICENCVLLAKGLNTRLLRPLPTNPHDLIERFSCNLEEIGCVMDRCSTCCVAEIDLEKQPSDDDSSDSADENATDQVIYFTWKKIEKSKMKSKAPTLEIKAFRSLHRVAILKV